MKFEIHKAGVDSFAANLIGVGFTRGSRLKTVNGTGRGCRFTLGLWWVTLCLWLNYEENP